MSAGRIAMLVAGVAVLVAALALGAPKLLSGDHDEHGRVAVDPGRGVVELPSGEVIVFYEEGRPIPIDKAVPEPRVEWEIRAAGGGEPLPLDDDGGRETNVQELRAWTDIERLDVPEAGSYEVVIRDVTTGGADPALTFGSSGVTAAALVLTIGGLVVGSALITLALFLGRRGE